MDNSNNDFQVIDSFNDISESANDLNDAADAFAMQAELRDSGDLSSPSDQDFVKVDLTVQEYPEITKNYNDTPHSYFDTSDFYKHVLKNCGEDAQRLHTTLTKYLTTEDQSDRGVYREQLVATYWRFIEVLAARYLIDEFSTEKRYALRYGLVLPTLLAPEQKNTFARIIDTNLYNEPIYYLDEWLEAIGSGSVMPSTTDEARIHENQTAVRLQQLFNKAKGKRQSWENLLRAKSNDRDKIEDQIKNRIDSLFIHKSLSGLPNVKAPFTNLQKKELAELMEVFHKLTLYDRELHTFYMQYQSVTEDVRSLELKVEIAGSTNNDVSTMSAELVTIRQMVKMACGKKGNHFPILSREFFRCLPADLGIRENVITTLRWIESIDKEAYCRYYRSQLNRIPPFVILVPSYGDIGFCWEPFDRYDRVTSRGRIVIPMYTKNLTNAVLMAVADLRWQVAKEKASYYWMEEGLTGNYYRWFQSQKLRGDVKDYFINDYITWITKESTGIQKLEREVRNVFWRYMPFVQSVKDKLRTMAAVYQELYQRDINRQMSDGY